MVAPPGDRFVLHLCEGFEPVQPGNSGIAFVTDGIEPLVARMEAAGVRFPQPLTKQAWGSMAKFEDPDGNVFWLMGASAQFIRGETRRKALGSPRRTTKPAPRRNRAAPARKRS